ncbi:uncharacterized protein [Rutidosis leptorrhynchoides]|uniref:uncharacterized protein n=1 Tax=Rutidosis leptorrhynchoides TaxID=125765 RepID=UPI003A995D84
MAAMIDEKRLESGSSATETIRNNSIPQKVAIFIWRAKLNRLPVRSELGKRGIDLDSVLCPICGNEIETVEHSLIKCKKVTEFWIFFFLIWWNVPVCNLNALDPLANDGIFTSFTKYGKSIWEAVKWVGCYVLWKSRNNKVFNRKEWSISSIISEVQTTTFGWIAKRSKKFFLDWHQWIINPEFYVDSLINRLGIG